MYSWRSLVLTALAAVVVTAAVIYFSPLKWLTLVEPTVHDVDPQEFYAAYTANPDDFIFIDVRQPDSYKTAHAVGSVNQPIGSLYDGHKLLPRSGKKIVLICSSGRLAGVAYGFLERQGFFNLLRIEGGVQAWAMAGLPLEGENLAAPIPEMD